MAEALPPDEDRQEKIDKMATMTVAAARGIAPMGQVMLPLAQIAQSELAPAEARELARVLGRILAGERDPVALVAELSPDLAETVWEVLEQIEAPAPALDQVERVGLSLEELLQKVAEACGGEVLLWQELWDFTEELSTDERLSPDIRALGLALRKVLAGERQRHVLEGLSAKHRWAVAQLLDWLAGQAAEPGTGENE